MAEGIYFKKVITKIQMDCKSMARVCVCVFPFKFLTTSYLFEFIALKKQLNKWFISAFSYFFFLPL